MLARVSDQIRRLTGERREKKEGKVTGAGREKERGHDLPKSFATDNTFVRFFTSVSVSVLLHV